jgi:ribosome-associated translation inhibitor RaiA
MIQIKFKNLDKSELAKEAVIERIEALSEKFEDLGRCRIVVTLEMENSPAQPGPDLFNVKLHIANGRFAGITVTKSDSNLYKALADMVDHMLEKLNRTGDKERVRERTKARQLNRIVAEQKMG